MNFIGCIKKYIKVCKMYKSIEKCVKVLTSVKQFGIIQIGKWKPKTVATMIRQT